MKTWLTINDADDTIYGVSQLTGKEAPAVEAGQSVFEVDASVYGSVFSDPTLIYKWDRSSSAVTTVVNPDPNPAGT